MPYAHTPGTSGGWHDLVEHLRGTATLAGSFGEAFGAGELAYHLGLWHDLGKFHKRFQAYLEACQLGTSSRGHGPDHKAAGAKLALRHRLGPAALVIQGHHGGLKSPGDFKSWLADRAKEGASDVSLMLGRAAVADLEPGEQIHLPAYVEHDQHSTELFLRLVFSCLVDADFLDTERHFDAARADQRRAGVAIAELWERLRENQGESFANSPRTTVNLARQEIYAACLKAAEQEPGLFRLTVPTGGGKTRSGLAFALRHALLHGLRRVVVAIPYLSITEQTANVYRSIFASNDETEPVVLEHHSSVRTDPDDEDDFGPRPARSRLAAENWDAPIVVTTTVQLFESLFSNRTSRCRKLHRLAGSVIILDEAQSLPPHLLAPILDGLRQLCTHYGATVVMSTATQPAFEAIPIFAEIPAREIVPEPIRFFDLLRRVDYELRLESVLSWTEVAALMSGDQQVLAILNTKKDALTLLDALDDPGALHLSTLLCGAHRRAVINEVKRRLAYGQPCRLVSTQVVEAGVDLDFPLVLRALGPLDSIIQAAGRCNREGRLARGRVIVFQPAEGGLPGGSYRVAANITRGLLQQTGVDLDDPAVSRAYYRQLFETVDTDREQIQPLRSALDYPEVAQRFRLIDDDSESVVITTYGSEAEQRRVVDLLDQLRGGAGNPRFLLRRLQPYVVSIYSRAARRYQQQGFIEPLQPGLGRWNGAYDAVRGLVAADPDPDTWVV